MPDVPEMHETSSTATLAAPSPPESGGGLLRSFFSHPKGLYPLFFTEMWERFSFYLMLNLLAIYLSDYLSFSKERSSDVATWYMSLVYFTPFIGGLIADRLTGYVRAVLVGGLLMMAGHVALAFDTKGASGHPFLYASLALLICGNGLFKPNISTMVGRLYAPGDPRRDQGFTIFYMGINVGAMLGPLTAGRLRKFGPQWAHDWFGLNLPADSGWHIAFASAGVGMLLSLLIFSIFRRRIDAAGAATSEAERFVKDGEAIDDPDDKVIRFGQWFNMGLVTFFLAWLLVGNQVPWPEPIKAIGLWPTNVLNFAAIWLVIEAATVLIFLSGGTLQCANAAKLKAVFIVVALFWMAFHQNSVSLLFFAADHTRDVGSGKGQWSPEDFGAINAVFILLFSPLMMILWNYLGRRGREPSSVSKMILAMFVTGLAYVVMVGAGLAGGDTGRVSAGWLIGCYALLTVAELWLSPIGLSLTSKLAPVKYRGLWMGFWFLATAVGNKLVHVTGQYVDKFPPSQVFTILVVTSIGAAVALDYILINLRRFGPPSTDA
jgi:POT family proton-dependent oligopeptide transporter